MKGRSADLLAAAADCFEANSDPFSREWLDAHQVSLDECAGLAEQIALAIRVYLILPAAVAHHYIVEAALIETVREALRG